MQCLTEIVEILQPRMETTHTATSQLGNCDATAETSISHLITIGANADFSQPLATCKDCGGNIQIDLEIAGAIRRLPIICPCRAETLRKEKEREERLKIQRRLDKFKAYSLMDGRFEQSTFENWLDRDDNRNLREFARRYCENWDAVFAANKGVLFYGKAGSGKSYAAFAIANELYRQGKAVLAISVSRILDIIKDSYSKHGEVGEVEIFNTLGEASLLVLDDLGVEYKTAWAYERLYNIIDTRYRVAKPTIITTNLSIDALKDNLSIVDIRANHFDYSHRIYDRIIEMTAFQEVSGESWRTQKGEGNLSALGVILGL